MTAGRLNDMYYSSVFTSVLDDSVNVRIFASLRDPRKFGTFDPEIDSAMIVVTVRFEVPFSDPSNPVRHRHGVRGADIEYEGWARALLGDYWSDYAYRIDSFTAITAAHPVFFLVFLELPGRPFLAPADFRWRQFGAGGPIERRKLPPSPTNRELVGYLRSNGDVTPLSPNAGPRIESQSIWRTHFYKDVIEHALVEISDGEFNSDPARPVEILSSLLNHDEASIVIDYKIPRRRNIMIGFEFDLNEFSKSWKAVTPRVALEGTSFLWSTRFDNLVADHDGIRWMKVALDGESAV
ncbi:hypothetical protein [Rhodococcus sp. ARC_M6]|uniref:hypothetical protein n=1 Tax=Rhodococcus sp. ARC_M6 TaxID=2928852 RepID=UPI001FB26E87|nr:hypothetical protein [Rhodococcus sp. ARC_M6]MCJ0907395.1 hypothetical protein [Rhodococcus sp. ARC_M6]